MLRLNRNQLRQVGKLVLDPLNYQAKSFSCTKITANLKKEWETLAQKQLKGAPLDSLNWNTSEVINLFHPSVKIIFSMNFLCI